MANPGKTTQSETMTSKGIKCWPVRAALQPCQAQVGKRPAEQKALLILIALKIPLGPGSKTSFPTG